MTHTHTRIHTSARTFTFLRLFCHRYMRNPFHLRCSLSSSYRRRQSHFEKRVKDMFLTPRLHLRILRIIRTFQCYAIIHVCVLAECTACAVLLARRQPHFGSATHTHLRTAASNWPDLRPYSLFAFHRHWTMSWTKLPALCRRPFPDHPNKPFISGNAKLTVKFTAHHTIEGAHPVCGNKCVSRC